MSGSLRRNASASSAFDLVCKVGDMITGRREKSEARRRSAATKSPPSVVSSSVTSSACWTLLAHVVERGWRMTCVTWHSCAVLLRIAREREANHLTALFDGFVRRYDRRVPQHVRQQFCALMTLMLGAATFKIEGSAALTGSIPNQPGGLDFHLVKTGAGHWPHSRPSGFGWPRHACGIARRKRRHG